MEELQKELESLKALILQQQRELHEKKQQADAYLAALQVTRQALDTLRHTLHLVTVCVAPDSQQIQGGTHGN